MRLSVQGPHRESYTQFKLPGERLHPEPRNPYLDPSSGNGPNPARKQLLAAWGEPQRKKPTAAGEGETWIWRQENSIWSGTFSIVGVVPVPLMLPLDRESTEVSFGPGDGPAREWIDQTQGDAYWGIGMSGDMSGRDSHHGPFFWHSDFEKRRTPVGPVVHEIRKPRGGGGLTSREEP